MELEHKRLASINPPRIYECVHFNSEAVEVYEPVSSPYKPIQRLKGGGQLIYQIIGMECLGIFNAFSSSATNRGDEAAKAAFADHGRL
ncbi:hypothetical protein RB195_009989 [Necator americanus]|uniref:Uncharacterized protein n=1 Tax=Necator americanus TaxID=51031 RepID=A0ABR1CVU6_NECAM